MGISIKKIGIPISFILNYLRINISVIMGKKYHPTVYLRLVLNILLNQKESGGILANRYTYNQTETGYQTRAGDINRYIICEYIYSEFNNPVELYKKISSIYYLKIKE